MQTINVNNELSWNVIDNHTFRQKTENVFRQVAATLSNTLGPYGSTTILEQFGETHFTKDGWNILKKIQFNSPVEQTILNLLVNISSQVVIKVGDGSTSSIIAADEFLSRVSKEDELKNIRPKELHDTLQKVVNMVTQEILKKSEKITKENDPTYKKIYDLALVSTNGDAEVANYIQRIYQETDNPNVVYGKSKTAETKVEIVTGYETRARYLDAIYATNDEGDCVVQQPIILMFDHVIDKDPHFDLIIAHALQISKANDRRLVVITPHYSKFMTQFIRQTASHEFNSTGTSSIVYTQIPTTNSTMANEYNDFAILTGGSIVTEGDVQRIARANAIDEEGNLRFPDEDAPDVADFLGTVGRMTIRGDSTLAEGFDNKNEKMYDIALRDANARLKAAEDNQRSMAVIDIATFDLKKRIAKLQCKMGAIYAGGRSTLEKQANFDLIEDAVKAAESAYRFGYNVGGNLIIPIAIGNLKKSPDVTETEKLILDVLEDAFRGVFARVIRNKYSKEEKTDEVVTSIINRSVELEQCYNLITDEYSSEVINPSYTDVEILNATTSIVSLVTGSNQYVTIRPDVKMS